MENKLSGINKRLYPLNKRIVVIAMMGGMVGFPRGDYAVEKMPASVNVPANAVPANRGPYDRGEEALYKSEDEKIPSSSINTPETPLQERTQTSPLADVDPAVDPTRTTGTRAQ